MLTIAMIKSYLYFYFISKNNLRQLRLWNIRRTPSVGKDVEQVELFVHCKSGNKLLQLLWKAAVSAVDTGSIYEAECRFSL